MRNILRSVKTAHTATAEPCAECRAEAQRRAQWEASMQVALGEMVTTLNDMKDVLTMIVGRLERLEGRR